MPILTLQKRARELGRIRTGDKGGKGQPQKLSTFRLTSASKPLLEKVAELYGGTVQEWTPQGGAPQWEVYTTVARIPILVPPQPVSQWLETWTAGGCVHRCDGETDYITGEACDGTSKLHLEAKPTTRLNVILKDVEGIGVWRLESHGWNAAVELPEAAEFLAAVGGYVNGWVALEERVSKSEGKTRRFLVPTIEIDVTPAELMAGRGSITPPSVEGPVAAAALESGRPDYATLAEDATTVEEVRGIWKQAADAGHLDDNLRSVLTARADEFTDAIDGEIVDDDPAELWQACVTRAGELGMDLWAVEADLKNAHGVDVPSASAEILQTYLEDLRGRDAA